MRMIQLAGSLLLGTMLMVGCTDSPTEPDQLCEPLPSLLGSWTATTYTVDGEEILVGTPLSFTVTFMSDKTFSESISGDASGFLCAPDPGPSCTGGGRYIQTDVELVLCGPECEDLIEYTISDDTLNVSFTEDDLPVTATFVRVSA